LAFGKLIGRDDDRSHARPQGTSLGEWVGGVGRRAEMHRAGIEKRFAPRKIEIAVDRFEANPGKPELVRLLNAQADE
jgi:hypothetical protein